MLLLNFSVSAQEKKVRADNPCKSDVMKYCAANADDKAARAKCLQENMKKLSPACVARIKKIREKIAQKRANEGLGAKPQAEIKPQTPKVKP
jgi:hypothetical protein